MYHKHLFTFIILLIYCTSLSAQFVSDKQLLKLELHPTDSTKFIAKMYNYKTGKLEEYWEMITHVHEISISDFNNQVQLKEIEPHGKYYIFNKNRVKKMEANYEYGAKMGETKGFYDTGELRFQGTYNYNKLEGKLIQFFKDGTKKNEAIFNHGLLHGKSIGYYPSGKIYMETNYNFGETDGKQIIFSPNGYPKREMKYKMNELVSEKCYDINGAKIECRDIIIEPGFVQGKNQFLTYLTTFTFNNDETINDTLLLNISLEIDTSGNVQFKDFDFTGQDSLQSDLVNWLQKPGIFTPMLFDDKPVECVINLYIPVYKNKVLILNEFDKRQYTTRNSITQEDEVSYFWNFSSIDKNTYFIVEKMPEFPGGEFELRKFIAYNIKYPVIAQENGIQGKVYVTFVIDKNGYPVDIRVAHGIHPVLNEEAIRVISTLPKWSPGMQRGKPVRVSYTVPVNFILGNKNANINIE